MRRILNFFSDLSYTLTRPFRIIKEIRNYYYIKRIIRKNKGTKKWKELKLRNNWFGTIGTVINLPPNVFSGEEIYYQVYIIEQMKPINEYLESLNLQEVISPNIQSLVDREQGIYAYLIKYKPLFREFTFGWIITRILFILLLLWLNSRYDIFSRLWSIILELPSQIINILDSIFF